MKRNNFEDALSDFREKIIMPLSCNNHLYNRKVKSFAKFLSSSI